MKYETARRIAKLLKWFGFRPKRSWSIADTPTKGYGKLDDNGFWQFPLQN